MSIWAEAHDLPHIANAGKKIAWLPALGGQFGKHADAFREEGSIRLPVAYSRIGEVFNVNPDDHSEDVGSVIHLYQKGVVGGDGRPDPVFSFVPERRPDELESPATGDAQLSGRGLTPYFLDRVNLLPYDSPANPSVQPDWNFGESSDGGIVENGSFENDGFPNGGFELGNEDNWYGTIDNDPLTRPATITVGTGADARTGDYYGLVLPNAAGSSGARRSISGLVPGKPYIITGWLKDPSSSRRFRAGINNSSFTFHTNAYEEDGYWWAELGNATQGNGNSNGSYQQFVIQFYAASSTTELLILSENASDDSFIIDDWNCAGFGLGVGPWEAFSLSGSVHNIFERSTNFAQDGEASLAIQGVARKYTDPFGAQSWGTLGATQRVGVVPGRRHTGSAWFYHESGSTEQFWVIWKRAVQSGPLGQSSLGAFPIGTWMHSAVVNVPSGVWTKVELSAIPDVSQMFVEIVWKAADISVPDTGGITSPTFYIDNVKVWEGEGATNIGSMWLRFLAKTDALDWLVPSFDATNDSNGDPWDKQRSLSMSEGQSLGQIAESLQNLFGYVHRIRYDREDNTYYFDVYNPGYVAFDHSTTDTGMLVAGMNIHGGEVVTRSPGATVIRGVLDSGAWSETEDAGLKAAWGRADQRLDLGEISEMDDAIEAIGVSLNRTKDEMVTFQAEGTDTGQVVPFTHYDIFHKVGVNLGAKSGIPVGDRIVTSMVCSWKPGQRPQVQSFVNSDAFASSGMAALAEAVRRLLRRPEKKKVEASGVGFGGGGAGGQPTVVVAASNATELSKSKADFVCVGTDDEATINLAAELLQAVSVSDLRGGRLVLTEGTYSLSAVVQRPAGGAGVIFQGSGNGTLIQGAAASTTMFALDAQDQLTDMVLTTTQASVVCVDMIGARAQISNVAVDNSGAGGIGVRISSGERQRIVNCEIDAATAFVNMDRRYWELTKSLLVGVVDLGDTDGAAFVGNLGSFDQIISDGLNYSIVSDNKQFASITIEGSLYDSAIVGNGFESFSDPCIRVGGFMDASTIATNTMTGGGIEIEDSEGGAVVGNAINWTPTGIHLVDSSRTFIEGNRIELNGTGTSGIIIEGASSDNHVQGNHIDGSFGGDDGIVIADSTCEDNVVVGNGVRGSFSGDALVDNGTGTILTYPGDPTYGDNFVG